MTICCDTCECGFVAGVACQYKPTCDLIDSPIPDDLDDDYLEWTDDDEGRI
jgi:hypothetical protein